MDEKQAKQKAKDAEKAEKEKRLQKLKSQVKHHKKNNRVHRSQCIVSCIAAQELRPQDVGPMSCGQGSWAAVQETSQYMNCCGHVLHHWRLTGQTSACSRELKDQSDGRNSFQKQLSYSVWKDSYWNVSTSGPLLAIGNPLHNYHSSN